MKKLALILSLLSPVLALAQQPSLLRKGDVVDLFGDSITYLGGYLDIMRQGLPGIKLVNRGINGGKSTDLRDGCWDLYGCTQAPFAQVLKQDNATVAVIYIGINDVWHGDKGNPPKVYEACLRELVAAAKKQGVATILATPTLIGELPQGQNPFDKPLDAYAEIVKKVGKESGLTVVDLRSALFSALDTHYKAGGTRTDKGYVTYDGVHMAEQGNRIIAGALRQGVEKALKSAKPRRDQSLLGNLKLVPWPNEVSLAGGALNLKATARVVYESAPLEPLARVFAGEIRLANGLDLKTAKTPAKAGDVVLRLDKALKGEAYSVQVGDKAVVSGGSYGALAAGTVTLLQALNGGSIPKMSVRDEPTMGYRGLMVDVARRYHPVDVLKQCVEICRLYKIRYMQLHLCDDQSFTFPSKAYPLLTQGNQHGGPSYTLAELKDLVKYADERGVTIIPEFEVPGHAAAMIRAYPDLFKIKGTKPYEHHATINFANAEVLKAVDILVGEFCEVFKSAPYFHIGGDEADYSNADQHPDFQAKFKELGLGDKGQWELFRWFLCRMNEIVKKRGKKMLVWEGFGRDPNSKFPIPKDVTVMEFESAYYLPEDLVADGFTLINAAWSPLYQVNRHLWNPDKIYSWNPWLFGTGSPIYSTINWHQIKQTPSIVGAQTCAWEQPGALEVQSIRLVLAAMAERVWNPKLGRPNDDFAGRLSATDALLEKLVHTVSFEPKNLNVPGKDDYASRSFSEPMSVAMKAKPGLTIRFTLDDTAPTATSPAYSEPIELKGTTTVRAAAFDADGKRVGWETSDVYYYVPKPIPNLATGKPVTVSGGTEGPQTPELAVDGLLDTRSSWWAKPAPQWLKIDLQKACKVDRIKVYPYWDGRRYYQYTVEVSLDGETWALVGDRKENSVPASSQGDEFMFPACSIRYVRVNMIRGSANEGVHIVEVEVFEAK